MTTPGTEPSLFAKLDAATGRGIGRCPARHRAPEFRAFLREIEANVPAELVVPPVMENAAPRKMPAARSWLAKRPRWHVRFPRHPLTTSSPP